MSGSDLITAASGIIQRAMSLESENKLTESLVCFQEGIGLLLKALKSQVAPEDKGFKTHLRKKITEYMDKAESLKGLIKKEIKGGQYHEQIVITEGSAGNGYQRIFGRFLSEGTVKEVYVEDPYIRSGYQIENFSHFCEILVRSESPIRQIRLITGHDTQKPEEQLEKFQLIRDDLLEHSVGFEWKFDDALHDREIRFDNGWIVKIGRGLDYIRRSKHKFCGLGVHDYDFRQCSATTVDIFHRSTLRVVN
ncbi:Microtubule interacting and transport domain containing 1 [Fasciolopsis buskii]|uniref:Microtubule interacting and transport domain containing 1 n=1 Tax=Fasciolopsis buskii TaxID=27845 RepID=A0A8E0RUY8_9TREM|nr:Microtubule interacting and transport domain containing 1 [Fasciolopsis buski]